MKELLMLAITVFFVGICILIANKLKRNKESNVKSSTVYTSKISVADLFKIDAIAKKYFCSFSVDADKTKMLAKVQFFGDERRYVAADELDCFFNRRFEGHERHRV